MTPYDYLKAARVPRSLQPQEFGLWAIQRLPYDTSILREMGPKPYGAVGWPDFTLLRHGSGKSIHLGPDGYEIVMEDSARELRRHLPIWLAAHGRVLVTGLGLGCVVRGLLANPNVDHIDVVEIDPQILGIVGVEFAAESRVTFHRGDALKIDWPTDARWDFAWHDLWVDGDGLQVLHVELMQRFYDRCSAQGAWQLPRLVKRIVGPLMGERLLV